MNTLESDIVSLFGMAENSVLIVAPFIRSKPLGRLLDSIPDDVDTTVVTRWHIADLLAGASDLDVYKLTETQGIPLYLHPDLHAKLFAADDKCLVGSANVTDAALGRRLYSNLELLVLVSRTSEPVVEFEKQLFSRAVRATAAQRDRLEEVLERLHLSETPIIAVEDRTLDLMPSDWVPRARNPEELYSVYKENADVGYSTQTLMHEELETIGLTVGLSEEEFRKWIATKISQTPLVGRVMQRIDEQGQVTEVDIRKFLTEIGVDADKYQHRDLLEVLERWLTYFLSTRYETARDSVKLIRARKL